jgi:hypothetical protein
MVVQVKENEKEDALMDVTRTQKQAADLRRQLDDTQVASSLTPLSRDQITVAGRPTLEPHTWSRGIGLHSWLNVIGGLSNGRPS